ncbi:MAG: hypothetical protein EXR79_12140 [Myxococcales bacterium]|nr:hypothetical protein [Myxococcales bacterium]
MLEPFDQYDPRFHWEYIDYHLNDVRTLEVHAGRDNDGNLTMMLEELVEERCGRRMVGRCIHLDTNCRPGTAADAAPLNHLDLAINVYIGDAMRRRKARRLCDHGKVEDASFRTHLFRVDGAPFASIAEFA